MGAAGHLFALTLLSGLTAPAIALNGQSLVRQSKIEADEQRVLTKARNKRTDIFKYSHKGKGKGKGSVSDCYPVWSKSTKGKGKGKSSKGKKNGSNKGKGNKSPVRQTDRQYMFGKWLSTKVFLTWVLFLLDCLLRGGPHQRTDTEQSTDTDTRQGFRRPRGLGTRRSHQCSRVQHASATRRGTSFQFYLDCCLGEGHYHEGEHGHRRGPGRIQVGTGLGGVWEPFTHDCGWRWKYLGCEPKPLSRIGYPHWARRE